jgi:hypothetical protein
VNAKARHRRRTRALNAARIAQHFHARGVVDTHVDSACRAERAWVKGQPHWTLHNGLLHVVFTAVKRGTLEQVVANGTVSL